MLPVTWGFPLTDLDSWVIQTIPPPIYSGWPRDYCILWKSIAKTYLFLKAIKKTLPALHSWTYFSHTSPMTSTSWIQNLMACFNLFFIWWTQWNNFKELDFFSKHFSKFYFTYSLMYMKNISNEILYIWEQSILRHWRGFKSIVWVSSENKAFFKLIHGLFSSNPEEIIRYWVTAIHPAQK